MPRHSKNNTAGSVFTHHEKHQLKEFGTQQVRLGKDSFKRIDQCALCLQTLIDPLCCSGGHMYCKGCIFESIVHQKKSIRRQYNAYKKQKALLESQEQEKEMLVQESVRTNFEKRESGVVEAPVDEGPKRFTLAHSGLNNFWLPSKTPVHVGEKIKKPSKILRCPEGDHPVTTKELTVVNMMLSPGTEESENPNDIRYQCPSCLKLLNNVQSVKIVKICGHVLCGTCMDNFSKTGTGSTRCFVCSIACDESDIINLQKEETAYTSRTGTKLSAKVETPVPRL